MLLSVGAPKVRSARAVEHEAVDDRAGPGVDLVECPGLVLDGAQAAARQDRQCRGLLQFVREGDHGVGCVEAVGDDVRLLGPRRGAGGVGTGSESEEGEQNEAHRQS